MRLGFAGTLALSHGYGKLTNLLQGATRFPDPLGVGPVVSLAMVTFAELVCALALTVGLASRLAAVPLVFNFAVALFVVHAGDPMEKRELALLYLVAFATLLLAGPGRLSLDEWLRRR